MAGGELPIAFWRHSPGTVNLTRAGTIWDLAFGSGGVQAWDLAPCFHGCCLQLTMTGGWDVVTGNVKEVGNRVVDGNKALKLPG